LKHALKRVAMRKPTVEISARPRWALIAALTAAAFGLLTIAVGGSTLVSVSADRAAAGNIVPFVLWFNFAAGFAYVVAGVGLFSWKPWSAPLSAAIAIATLVVFIAFGIHVFFGGAFETRTVGAMALRSILWIVIAVAACRAFRCWPNDRRSGRILAP
jgi:hypothetical protein